MDALTVGRGKGLLAACVCAALAAGNVGFARAETTANQRSARAEWSSLGEKTRGGASSTDAENSDDVNALLLSGAVAFNPDPTPSAPPGPTPTPTPTPIPPVSGPWAGPVPPPPPKLLPSGPDASPGPFAPPGPSPIPPVQSPEPASLLIGLIGSACAGVAGWKRRNRLKTA